MQLLDFDAHFAQTLNAWIEQNRKRFKRPEAMEDAAADLYETWLQTPAEWLNGATPGGYYNQFDDAGALVELLTRHIAEEVPVPDPLLTRLAELGDEEALLALVRDAQAPCEARMTGIALLRQLESRAPMVDYIRWQVTREVDADLLDNALESLRDMGDAVRRPVKVAFTAADDAGKDALLDVLADFPADDDVVAYAIRRFTQCPDKRALFAGYLGKLGDERALEPLLDAAESAKVSYIDFIEIRNAIERLGGEAPARDFEGDPTYIAVKRLQKR